MRWFPASTSLCPSDDLNLKYGLGWRYGLKDEFAKVNTKVDTKSAVGGGGLGGGGGREAADGSSAPNHNGHRRKRNPAGSDRNASAGSSVWPGIAGLYLAISGHKSRSDLDPGSQDRTHLGTPPRGYNALDLDLYLTSRTFAVLDAALYGYVSAIGIASDEREGAAAAGQRGGGTVGTSSGGGGEAAGIQAPCGHIGAGTRAGAL